MNHAGQPSRVDPCYRDPLAPGGVEIRGFLSVVNSRSTCTCLTNRGASLHCNFMGITLALRDRNLIHRMYPRPLLFFSAGAEVQTQTPMRPFQSVGRSLVPFKGGCEIDEVNGPAP